MLSAQPPVQQPRGRPAVTVVVPTRDRPELLDRCLATVRAALHDDDELLVVDSASLAVAAVARVAAAHGARLLRCDRPGVGRARNAGWRAASYDLVLFTDDDVRVEPGWADAVAGCFVADPGLAFVTGRIGVPAGQEGRLAVAVKDDPEPAMLDAGTRVLFGHGANMAMQRAALRDIGGFDEALGAGGRFRAAPEGDLFDRLLAAGHVGRYEPSARTEHDQWRRVREVVRLEHGYGIGSGARMAKLLRTDRTRLRVVAAEYLWGWGLAPLPGYVRRRDWHRVVATLARLAGYAVGFVRAVRVPVRDGHFASSSA